MDFSFPFPSHLKTNYVPSDAEILQIKSFLIQPSQTLQKIEDEMFHVREHLESLARKHEELARQLSNCRSLLTLPRRLPDDILREIFHHSLPTGLNACLKRQSAPLIFTQVCSRWRQLAISTPTLWSTIHIPLNLDGPLAPQRGISTAAAREESISQEFHRRRAVAVTDWLKRSGSLGVHISLFGGAIPMSSSLFNLYIKSLVPFSARWVSLFLQAPSSTLQGIEAISARDLKALESLFLQFERSPGVRNQPFGDSPWINSELFMAPSLRKLSICQDLFDPTAIRVNWSILTHLEIGGSPDPWGVIRHSPFLSLSKASSILNSCANLVYCSIELGPCWRQGNSILTMRLPVLQRLSIGVRIDIQPFVERLDTPALEELDFRSYIRSIEHPEHSSCLSILSRSGGTVQKLTINAEFFSNRHFLESLGCCPYLISLTVGQMGKNRESWELNEQLINKHFRIDDPFLERLTTTTANLLCPHLEELICEIDANFTLTGFFEFLWQKQMMGHTIGLSKLKNLLLRSLPDPCTADEFDLPAISELLEPYTSDMKF